MAYPLRPNVLRMAPYSPGKPIDEVKRELGLSHVVKLASNENPLGPSPRAMQAVRDAVETLHLYPDAAAFELRRAISQKFDVPEDQVLVGNGSDELIHFLGQVFLGSPDDQMVVGDPSFVRYDAAAELADCRLVKVPLTSDLRHDLPAMARAVTPNTKLLWIANPNNPTGTMVTRAELDELFAALPPHVTVVLDEAYHEYAAHEPAYPNSLDYLRAGRQVVGLRTFSKAYGLAGIRIGYGFAAPEVVDAIHRAREPFNANSLAQAAAIAALQDDEFIHRTVKENATGREFLNRVFMEHGAKPVPSFANFVCADIGRPAKPVFEDLLRRGVIVRSGHVLGLPTYLRVSIGTAEENQAFAEAFKAVMGQAVTA